MRSCLGSDIQKAHTMSRMLCKWATKTKMSDGPCTVCEALSSPIYIKPHLLHYRLYAHNWAWLLLKDTRMPTHVVAEVGNRKRKTEMHHVPCVRFSSPAYMKLLLLHRSLLLTLELETTKIRKIETVCGCGGEQPERKVRDALCVVCGKLWSPAYIKPPLLRREL